MVALAAACGDDGGRTAGVTTDLTIGLVAPAAGPDDVVVAEVNGRPVWGSCVAAQAAGRGVDRRAALADCIDLELGAQEAERRGLHRDPDVLERVEQALVARFVDREFTARHRTPADLPASFVEPIMRRNEWRLQRDEYRGSFFARVDAPEATAPRGSPADVAAERVIRAAYRALEGRRDLFPVDLEQALRAVAGPDVKVSFASWEPTTGDNVQPWYRDALFALTTIGEVSPPVRNPYGWDLILWTRTLPALEQTREDVLGQLFPAMRQHYFLDWAAQLERHHRLDLADVAVVERLLGGAPVAAAPTGRGRR